jgi:hypothetical protein
MEEPKIIYSSYTEAQKRATAKYREANKEKVNAQRKKYYESRKEKDPEFLQYKRDKAKEYYLKKKSSKVDIIDDTNIELVKIDEPIEPEVEETIEEHWLKKSQARDAVPEPDEEKPPLAWSNDEVKVEPVIKKERKPRAPKPKPNLKLEDLQELINDPISEPKTPKRPRSKKILGPSDILHSA